MPKIPSSLPKKSGSSLPLTKRNIGKDTRRPNVKKSNTKKTESLYTQIQKDNYVQESNSKKRFDEDDHVEGEDTMDAKITSKVLQLAREQQDEELMNTNTTMSATTMHSNIKTNYKAESESEEDADSEEEKAQAYEHYEVYEEDFDIDARDAALIAKFMNPEPRVSSNLADIVMSKISQSESSLNTQKEQERASTQLNEKLVAVYTKLGTLLSRYKSGKLPKTFKIIPSLKNWEEVLQITNPDQWTPHAVYQATRIFASNLKANGSQIFYRDILLPRVREDISSTRKLNYHLYLALKKSLYKPAAFFKGILLPFLQDGPTLRESVIIASVITKVSIPVLHSAAVLLKIAEMPYSGPNSLFIRILCDKKYALPYKVVDAVVFHFLRFRFDNEHGNRGYKMPVLWHQSLLVFCQRYKEDLTPDQKDALLELIKVKNCYHESISDEIRREIVNSGSRGEIMEVDVL